VLRRLAILCAVLFAVGGCGSAGTKRQGSEATRGTLLVVQRGPSPALTLRAPDGKTVATLSLKELQQSEDYEGFALAAWDHQGRAWVSVQRRAYSQSIQPLRVTSTKITPTGDRFPGSHPAIAPDGKHLALVRDGHLVVRTISDGQERMLSTPELAEAPTWSPNGRQIATVSVGGGRKRGAQVVDVDADAPSARAIAPPGVAEGASLTAVAWLEERLVVNVACCGDYPDEVGVVDALSGVALFMPTRRCSAAVQAAVAAQAASTVTSVLGASQCVVYRLHRDPEQPDALLYSDTDGHLSRWRSGVDAPIADDILDAA
jgi:hypothetical protein